jgi:hypothetical protein
MPLLRGPTIKSGANRKQRLCRWRRPYHLPRNIPFWLQIIDKLKDAEIEQSRLDWKAGYIECCLDCAEFFGNKRDKSYPTESEMETIEKLSHDFIKNRKNN